MRYLLLTLAVVVGIALFSWFMFQSDDAGPLTPASVGQLIGFGPGPVVVGLIGLFYQPNRFLGFATVTLIVAAITVGRTLIV